MKALVEGLRAGEVIACATETLFGLLADARNADAVARVFAIKGRGQVPIGLLAPDLESVDALTRLNEQARALAAAHWPGPLSLVLRVRDHHGLAPGILQDGTVSVRVPGPSPALALVRAFGGVLTATSCNPSGQPAAETAAQARAYFPSLTVVPGDSPASAPSTIVDATGPELRVLRQGAVVLPAR